MDLETSRRHFKRTSTTTSSTYHLLFAVPSSSPSPSSQKWRFDIATVKPESKKKDPATVQCGIDIGNEAFASICKSLLRSTGQSARLPMAQIGEKGMINLISREDLKVSLESCYFGRVSHGGGMVLMFGFGCGCDMDVIVEVDIFSFSRVLAEEHPSILHTFPHHLFDQVRTHKLQSDLTSTLGFPLMHTVLQFSRPSFKFQVPSSNNHPFSFPITISHAHAHAHAHILRSHTVI